MIPLLKYISGPLLSISKLNAMKIFTPAGAGYIVHHSSYRHSSAGILRKIPDYRPP
jgi:hypothetical protein